MQDVETRINEAITVYQDCSHTKAGRLLKKTDKSDKTVLYICVTALCHHRQQNINVHF